MFDLNFSPAAPELLASASDDESVKVWRQCGAAADSVLKLVASFGDHTDSVLRVSWSPDGRILASGASNYAYYAPTYIRTRQAIVMHFTKAVVRRLCGLHSAFAQPLRCGAQRSAAFD